MRPKTALLAIVSLAASIACGGASPTPQNATVLPVATATTKPAPAVDLSPVAMPSSVVVLVHVAHVAATGDVLSDWAGQPLDVGSELTEMVGERIAKVVDLDAPADLVLTAKDRGGRREPDMAFAVGLPVRNFDAAKATLEGDYSLVGIGNGALEIQRSDSGRRDGDSDFRSCALAPEPLAASERAGSGGGRIVCSRTATSRDDILPYLTRGTAALASIKSDVHVEARPGPFHSLVKRERSQIVQSAAHWMGRALRPIWQDGAGDLADGFLESEKAILDANIDSKRGTAQLTVTTKSANALVTRMLTGHPDRAEPPPATFFRLPSDADLAVFEHGFDADQLAGPKASLLGGMQAALADEDKLRDADRKAFIDALGNTVDLFTLPMVYARGVDWGKAIPATSGITESSDASKIKTAIEQAAGWDVIGVDAPAEKITAVLKGWSAVLSRPGMVAAMGKDGPSLRVLAAPRNAPPKTVHLALTVTHQDYDYSGSAKPKKRPPFVMTLHTLVVPDKTTVWVVSALDEATAVAKARAIVSGTGGTLAGRAGLDAIKNGRINFGGFVTPRGLGMSFPILWLDRSPRYRATSDPLVGVSSASQFATPMILTAAEGASGTEHTLTISAEVPRAVLGEIIGMAPHLFH